MAETYLKYKNLKPLHGPDVRNLIISRDYIYYNTITDEETNGIIGSRPNYTYRRN